MLYPRALKNYWMKCMIKEITILRMWTNIEFNYKSNKEKEKEKMGGKHSTKRFARKVMVPILTLVLLTLSAAPSFAADQASSSGPMNTSQVKSIQDFKDYNASYWGNSYMSSLLNAGGISGYPDGTFRTMEQRPRRSFYPW